MGRSSSHGWEHVVKPAPTAEEIQKKKKSDALSVEMNQKKVDFRRTVAKAERSAGTNLESSYSHKSLLG